MVMTVLHTIGVKLLVLEEIHTSRCLKKALGIIRNRSLTGLDFPLPVCPFVTRKMQNNSKEHPLLQSWLILPYGCAKPNHHTP